MGWFGEVWSRATARFRRRPDAGTIVDECVRRERGGDAPRAAAEAPPPGGFRQRAAPYKGG